MNPRLPHLAAWVAMLPENAAKDWSTHFQNDLDTIKREIKDSDGAYRLAKGMLRAGVDPDLFPGLRERYK